MITYTPTEGETASMMEELLRITLNGDLEKNASLVSSVMSMGRAAVSRVGQGLSAGRQSIGNMFARFRGGAPAAVPTAAVPTAAVPTAAVPTAAPGAVRASVRRSPRQSGEVRRVGNPGAAPPQATPVPAAQTPVPAATAPAANGPRFNEPPVLDQAKTGPVLPAGRITGDAAAGGPAMSNNFAGRHFGLNMQGGTQQFSSGDWWKNLDNAQRMKVMGTGMAGTAALGFGAGAVMTPGRQVTIVNGR